MGQEKVLFVNACVRPNSRTYELAKHLLRRVPGDICEIDLYKENIRPLDLQSLSDRMQHLQEEDFNHPDFGYAHQFAEADTIVIAAPYWDLLFPAVLRSYLEMVTVTRITFAYSKEGRPQGLCRAKRLYYVTTAGGMIGDNNFGFDYVKALAQNLYGIQDVRFISAEGLEVAENDVDGIMSRAKAAIDKEE